jgi:preprotein translocase subunit SecE
VKELLPLFIWVVVIGAVFAFAWRKGYLLRLSHYLQETQDELKKCTWPTVDELKGSTAVVMITIALLGAFTVFADFLITIVVRLMTW